MKFSVNKSKSLWIVGGLLLSATLFFLVRGGTGSRAKPTLFSLQILTAENGEKLSFETGVFLVKKKELTAAKKVFEELLLKDPKDIALLNNLAYVHGEAGENDKAIEYLKMALQLSDQCAECYNNLGMILLRQSKTEDAEKLFSRAIALNPDFVDAQLNLAVLLEQTARFNSALALYQKAKPLAPESLKDSIDLRVSLLGQIAQPQRDVTGDK